ncbi:glycosyltransferase family 4 protein [Variovorax dokdonensis]|uniref:Glycosyltransferase family 4 protein n=1 Tax=Variovorax dokdonensis TaxID=344883 RepID=A0ABT7N9N1_9BURK|nr:glycosyltransferase family 4 protein [Variovorax dokdonensis]MDM0044628.1 glycosyltransferase family 4 protein [Variovorax dokdonensis]
MTHENLRVAFICKRRYMGKDVILDRYARLYEIPRQLAHLGHDVSAWCLDYQGTEAGSWEHDGGVGRLRWRSQPIRPWFLPPLLTYPSRLLRQLQEFAPDVLIGASDIPHVAIGSWLAGHLGCAYVADLYDNFEGFGQARIPGFVGALRRGVRRADLVITTSEPLREYVLANYPPRGEVVPMPSSVDLQIFCPMDRGAARRALGLPPDATLVGTAGGLHREKGVEPLYEAWSRSLSKHDHIHLVLAGPLDPSCPLPTGDRVHYLGQLGHSEVATLFNALDVGVISVLDTPFGRYCFPQKAYEMLACRLPVVAANVGAIGTLLAKYPNLLFAPGSSEGLAGAVLYQCRQGVRVELEVQDWRALLAPINERLTNIRHAPRGHFQ